MGNIKLNNRIVELFTVKAILKWATVVVIGFVVNCTSVN